MSTPVHRTPTPQSAAALTSARQRREGSLSGNSLEHALLQMQSSSRQSGHDCGGAARQGHGQGEGESA